MSCELLQLFEVPKKKTILVNPTVKKKRDALRKKKIEELFTQRREEMKHYRIKNSQLCPANSYAMLNDEYRLKQELIYGHDVNERDMTNGRTILCEAVAAGHYNIVRMLCYDFHADLQKPTLLAKQTPLHLAVAGSHRAMVSLFITFGADLNAQDGKGCTPLHYVQNMEILTLLFKFRVDPCIRNNEELTPAAYYAKYTPSAEQNKGLMKIMNDAEFVRALELGRLKAQQEEKLRQQVADRFALVTSANSTIVTDSNKKVKKPAMKMSMKPSFY